jgi:hypothetical protein
MTVILVAIAVAFYFIYRVCVDYQAKWSSVKAKVVNLDVNIIPQRNGIPVWLHRLSVTYQVNGLSYSSFVTLDNGSLRGVNVKKYKRGDLITIYHKVDDPNQIDVARKNKDITACIRDNAYIYIVGMPLLLLLMIFMKFFE